MKVIILAGGSGTRLWPLSRESFPKQFIQLQAGDLSLFQETFERSLLVAEADEIYVVTNEQYKFLVMKAIDEMGYTYPEANILVEPVGKNTLPAIYAGIYEIRKTCQDRVLVFPSDHKIQKAQAFAEIAKAAEVLAKESLVTFGVKPDEPNTGYGYIAPGAAVSTGFMVDEFKEKPDEATAITYIQQGYYWNAGIFLLDTELFSQQVKALSPEIYNAFEETDNLVDAFSLITKKISIDYGIMEKSNKVAVVPISVGWNDLGSYDAIYEVYEQDELGNHCSDDDILIDSKHVYINKESGKLVAAIGLEDVMIVDQADALLVCKAGDSQKVKQVVDALKARDDYRSDSHLTDRRPWGQYRVLDEVDDQFKVKRITVEKGKKLSYQMHHHRCEHWIVVGGMAKVTVDEHETLVFKGETIFIKPGQKHRLENPGAIPLELIEVQLGDYLEEDDIIRFDDDFGRC